VSIGPNGLFNVSGFQVNTEKTLCNCPDYQNRHEPCKHYFAAREFQKNGCKVDLELTQETACGKSGLSGKRVETRFDKQSTITRLAVLNTATEMLKTHRKAIELNEVVFLACQLEKWALGNQSAKKLWVPAHPFFLGKQNIERGLGGILLMVFFSA
jgi:hypothetical protein